LRTGAKPPAWRPQGRLILQPACSKLHSPLAGRAANQLGSNGRRKISRWRGLPNRQIVADHRHRAIRQASVAERHHCVPACLNAVPHMSDSEDSTPHCERCGGTTRSVTRVSPVGTWAGARIFECTQCQHQTWQDWLKTPPQPLSQVPQDLKQQQQQQQQQEPQSDEAEDNERS
jgi:hypothetical protein